MLSNVMPDLEQIYAQKFLKPDYLFVSVVMAGQVWSDFEQKFYKASKFEKRQQLEDLLDNPSRDPNEKTLIYVEVGVEAIVALFIN